MLTAEVQDGFGGDGGGDEAECVQVLKRERFSADLRRCLLVQFIHVMQLQLTQMHTVPRCRDTGALRSAAHRLTTTAHPFSYTCVPGAQTQS